MSKICGDERCCATTSIADTIEHGWGELDPNGFWEFPCPQREKHAAHDATMRFPRPENDLVLVEELWDEAYETGMEDR